jgi:predicted transcriptional regulator
MPVIEPSPSEAVVRAVLHLVMAGSLDSATDVAVDADDIAAMTGLSRAVVDRELEALVACGAADNAS